MDSEAGYKPQTEPVLAQRFKDTGISPTKQLLGYLSGDYDLPNGKKTTEEEKLDKIARYKKEFEQITKLDELGGKLYQDPGMLIAYCLFESNREDLPEWDIEINAITKQGLLRDYGIRPELADIVVSLERKAPGCVSTLAREFGIKNLARYPEDVLLKQYEERNENLPYVLVMYTRHDKNGWFFTHQDGFSKLFNDLKGDPEKGKPHYAMRIVEVDEPSDIAKRFIVLNKRYNPNNPEYPLSPNILGNGQPPVEKTAPKAQKGHRPVLFLLGGHGRSHGIRVSQTGDFEIDDVLLDTKMVEDVENMREEISKHVGLAYLQRKQDNSYAVGRAKAVLARGVTVIKVSCSTAYDSSVAGYMTSIARETSRALSCTVFAPTVDIYSFPQIDVAYREDGSLDFVAHYLEERFDNKDMGVKFVNGEAVEELQKAA